MMELDAHTCTHTSPQGLELAMLILMSLMLNNISCQILEESSLNPSQEQI